MKSLYNVCSEIQSSGLYTIGEDDIYIETLYNANKISIRDDTIYGDDIQDNIVLIKAPKITVYNDVILTANPKKSLVLFCDTLTNYGEISMTGKGPDTLPHDYHLVYNSDDIGLETIIIPAYANNQVGPIDGVYVNGLNGNNGENRQCGSGGTGSINSNNGGGYKHAGASGSGYAFGGGAGSGGETGTGSGAIHNVDTVYPMHGGNGYIYSYYGATEGVGNPAGENSPLGGYWNYNGGNYVVPQNIGVGGRIIIFCKEFINEGKISADGIDACVCRIYAAASGGASGGGAIDIFTEKYIDNGVLSVNGGKGSEICGPVSGNGGNGSITVSIIKNFNLLKAGINILKEPSGLNTNIFKNPNNQHIFDLSYLGILTFEKKTIEIHQENHYLRIGDILYYNIKEHKFDKAIAKNTIESEVCGGVIDVIDNNNFVLITGGKIPTDRYSFEEGTKLYLSDAHEGKLVSIEPNYTIKQIATQLSDGIMIDIQRGYRTPITYDSSDSLESYTKTELDEIIKNIW